MNRCLIAFFILTVALFAHAQTQTQAQTGDAVPVLPRSTTAPPETPQSAKPTEKEKRPTKLAAPAPLGSSAIVITKVVGEVGDQVVTSREVKINSAIEQAISEKPVSTEDGFKILNGSEKAFPGEVSRVLDEWSVYFEAKSLGSSTVAKNEVTKAISQVQDRWGQKTAWKDLEVGSDELKTFVERKLAAAEFQKLKSDPALSPVSDDEALAYYKKNRLRFGSLPFSSFSENIKAYLVKTQVERRLSEWHEILRRKYKTRNFISG